MAGRGDDDYRHPEFADDESSGVVECQWLKDSSLLPP